MDITEIVKYVQEHFQDILLVFTSMVTVASVIVKLTPTQKDDAFLAKIMPWIEKIALNKRV